MRTDGKKTKQRALKLKINELTLCNVGAQDGAEVVIAKTASKAELAKATFDRLLAEQQLRDIFWTHNDALRESTIAILEDPITYPDPIVSVEENLESFMSSMTSAVSAIKIDKADLPASDDALNLENDMTEAEKAKAKTDKETEDAKQIEDLKSDLVVAKALGEMSDAQKEHYKALSDEDKTAFIGKSAEDRDALIQKAAASDEEVTIDGVLYKKSVVGAEFDALKKLSDGMEAQSVAIKKMESAASLAEFTKTAETKYSHIAGEPAEKGAMLQYIDTAPEAIKKTLTATMDAQEVSMAKVFKDRSATGYGGPGPSRTDGSALAELKNLAKAKVDSKECTDLLKAEEVVFQENPELEKRIAEEQGQ